MSNDNFNEQFLSELEKEGIEHGKIVSIPEKKKGTAEDYLELERKIMYETKKHNTYPHSMITNALPLGD